MDIYRPSGCSRPGERLGWQYILDKVGGYICTLKAVGTVSTGTWLTTSCQPSNRGVIWDQEIYDSFSYNQDRTFFHSFELEDCLAGLSFVDEKEAKTFKKKMDEREKNAHKNTKHKPFGNSAGVITDGAPSGGRSHGLLGGIGNILPFGHRQSSSQHQVPAQSIIPPKEVTITSPTKQSRPASRPSTLDTTDPEYQDTLRELLAMGITEDQLDEHADFIKMYIAQKRAADSADGDDRKGRAAPPPPPTSAPSGPRLSPQSTGGTSASRRGPAPAPPPARRTRQDSHAQPAPSPSPPPSPPREPSPPRSRFPAPPPLAEAGKFATPQAPPATVRPRASSASLANPGPPPPPRPPKTPIEDVSGPPAGYQVPPPFQSERPVPPPPPSRGLGPPAPPGRDTSGSHIVSPLVPPPPLPPKAPGAPVVTGPPPPPPMPNRGPGPVSAGSGPPPPPPMPPSSGAPPAPPLPPVGGGPPPPPPLPPGRGDPEPVTANVTPPAAGGRGNLLADIRGGARLKKVSDAEKRDRSAAVAASGGGGPGVSPSTAPAVASADGGLAGALASALAARKSKVSHSGKNRENYSTVSEQLC